MTGPDRRAYLSRTGLGDWVGVRAVFQIRILIDLALLDLDPDAMRLAKINPI
jgi:hypothetical protein